jgi:hypothetical protein
MHKQTYMHWQTPTDIHTCILTYTHIHTYTHTHIKFRTLYIYACIRQSCYIHTYIHTYIHKYTHTHTHTHTHIHAYHTKARKARDEGKGEWVHPMSFELWLSESAGTDMEESVKMGVFVEYDSVTGKMKQVSCALCIFMYVFMYACMYVCMYVDAVQHQIICMFL